MIGVGALPASYCSSLEPQEITMFDIRAMPAELPEDLLNGLRATDTGTLGHFLDAGFMDTGMQARMPGARIAGRAITVQVTTPDSLIGHYALKFTKPGDILLIERGADQRTACWGGTTSVGAVRAGLAGLIMDGAGNDIAEASAVGLPIWCRSVTPITTKYRSLGGAFNIPVSCGGVVVNPGDAILADDNGIVVIRPERLAQVVCDAKAFRKKEDDLLQKLLDNPDVSYPDLAGTTEIIEAKLREQAARL